MKRVLLVILMVAGCLVCRIYTAGASPAVRRPPVTSLCGEALSYADQRSAASQTDFFPDPQDVARVGIVTKQFSCLQGRIRYMENGWSHAGYGEKTVVKAVHPVIGKKYGIYRDMGEIRHPDTHKILGHLISDIGILRIVDADSEKQLAVIEKSFTEVAVGDLLGPAPILPYSPPRKVKDVSPLVAGSVIAIQDLHTIASSPDILYIDLGSKQGVSPGCRLFVKGVAADGTNPFKGEILVLRVTSETATALLTENINEILLGDQVVSSKKPRF